MLLKLRQRMASEESGFTLVELLVVMLIIGLLAAIAIPSFFNQRDKAYDANAKEQARTAETAMETYATDNGGVYTGVTTAKLVQIENSLTNAVSTTKPYLSAAAAAGRPVDALLVNGEHGLGRSFLDQDLEFLRSRVELAGELARHLR